MDAFGLALTVVVMLGVVVAILLFERKRARSIERDLRDQAEGQTRGRARGQTRAQRDPRHPEA